MQPVDRRAGRGGGGESVIYTVYPQRGISSEIWITIVKQLVEEGDVMNVYNHLDMCQTSFFLNQKMNITACITSAQIHNFTVYLDVRIPQKPTEFFKLFFLTTAIFGLMSMQECASTASTASETRQMLNFNF